MNPILAGALVGSLMGFAFDIWAIMWLVRSQSGLPEWLRAITHHPSRRFALLSVGLFAHACWTLVGVLLGTVLLGLAPEKLAFGTSIATITLLTGILLAMVKKRYAARGLPMLIAFAASFGGLLPLFAY